MPYELRHCQIEIPELDDFLREYAALCEKYGMALEVGDYDYDGGSYVTIGKPDGGPYLNMEKSDSDIPCIRDAWVRAEAMWDAHCTEQQRLSDIQAAKDEQLMFARLKRKYEPDHQ